MASLFRKCFLAIAAASTALASVHHISVEPTLHATTSSILQSNVVSAINFEGHACAAIAAAVPKLLTLEDLPTGKTPWSTVVSVWRSLAEKEDVFFPGTYISGTVNTEEQGRLTTLPIWCSFVGITCSSIFGTASYGSIVSISLASLGLTGKLPSQIGDFQSLALFDVSSNSLSGTIPSSIGCWSSSITSLRMNNNSMVGFIPDSIGDLTLLVDLNIGGNLLTSKVPTAVGCLTSLVELDFGKNKLTGTIPSFISSLSLLQNLCLAENSLTGTIPPTISLLSALLTLDFSGNMLVGKLPSGLGVISPLSSLSLDFNSLTGAIPTTFETLKSLLYLNLSNNMMTGTIPNFSTLMRLSTLDVRKNYLTMGATSAVSEYIFSTTTKEGLLLLSDNCLRYVSDFHPSQSTVATHCREANAIALDEISGGSLMQENEPSNAELSSTVPSNSMPPSYASQAGDAPPTITLSSESSSSSFSDSGLSPMTTLLTEMMSPSLLIASSLPLWTQIASSKSLMGVVTASTPAAVVESKSDESESSPSASIMPSSSSLWSPAHTYPPAHKHTPSMQMHAPTHTPTIKATAVDTATPPMILTATAPVSPVSSSPTPIYDPSVTVVAVSPAPSSSPSSLPSRTFTQPPSITPFSSSSSSSPPFPTALIIPSSSSPWSFGPSRSPPQTLQPSKPPTHTPTPSMQTPPPTNNPIPIATAIPTAAMTATALPSTVPTATDAPSVPPTSLSPSSLIVTPSLVPSIAAPTGTVSPAPIHTVAPTPDTTSATTSPSEGPLYRPSLSSPPITSVPVPTLVISTSPSRFALLPYSQPAFYLSRMPTAVKSFGPSNTSSPYATSAPSVELAIPVVRSIIIRNTTRSSLSLSVTLTKTETVGDFSGGYLYCAAMIDGVVPSSIGSIKSASISGSIYGGSSDTVPASSDFPISLNLTIGGLIAIEAYAIFCYAESVEGTGTSLQVVVQSKVSTTTACCKSVTYSNAPVYVHSDVTKYRVSSSLLFVYSYSLPSSPLYSLTVTPALLFNGVNSTSVVAVPSSTTFTSTSPLTGHFYISTDSDTTGDCAISLSFTGANAAHYSVGTIHTRLLPSNSTAPAPQLVSCQLSDSGRNAMIRFDAPTDTAGIQVATWTCDFLFAFTGAATSTCTWLNPATVSVSFGVMADTSSAELYLNIGSQVTLIDRQLRAVCAGSVSACSSNLAASSATVETLAPRYPNAPTVIISAPHTLGSCSDLQLDATASYGNGGRPYTSVTWTATATKAAADTVVNTSALQAYLNAYSSAYQVSRPFVIAHSTLIPAVYSFTLELSNFLGVVSSTTVHVTVTSDSNTPVLTILGPSYQVVSPSSRLSILSLTVLPSCVSSASSGIPMEHTWRVFLSGQITALHSVSLLPTRFSLPPYSLAVDNTYTVTVTASAGKLSASVSASVLVYVSRGNVTAAVVGGYNREIPVDKGFDLDASISSDNDVDPTAISTLTFLWRCRIQSTRGFGAECGILGVAKTNASVLSILANTMSLNTAYAFTVSVSSLDGRTNTKTVLVTASLPDSVQLSITSSFVRFNAESKLVIESTILSPCNVTARWGVYSSVGLPLSFSSLTSQIRNFTTYDTATILSFPLSISGGTLSGGAMYAFRLATHPVGKPALTTFSEIQLFSNAPPSGGYVTVAPDAGQSLLTEFLVATPGWTSDHSSLPLRFSFAYRISESSAYITLSSQSLRAYTVAGLPAGLSALNNLITLQGQAMDMFQTTSVALTSVLVTANTSLNMSHILTSSLSDAFSIGDIDAVFLTVNNVATTLNTVECYNAPNCSALYREHCYKTSGTCGSCIDGFKGVVGDSNAQCRSVSAPYRVSSSRRSSLLSLSCAAHSDCLYGQCTYGLCTAPQLSCPSDNPGAICSNNGVCRYSDPSGNTRPSCTILDIGCVPSCVCNSTYGGQDCSLSAEELTKKGSIRSALCQALVTAATTQDKSPALLATLITSLQSSFSSYEVTSLSGKMICSAALGKISALSREGFLSTQGTAQSLTDLISAYSSYNNGTPSTTSSYTQRHLDTAVSSLVKGVQLGMSPGDAPVSLVSSKLQVTVISARVSDIGGFILAAPATAAQLAYGSIQPKITLGPNGLSECPNIGTYAQLSVLQWSTNPIAGSGSMVTPLLRLSSASQSTSAAASLSVSGIRRRVQQSGVTTPAYTIAIQFTATQDFNYNASNASAAERTLSNYTIPACTQYNGVEYVPCLGCNISSYTNYNVTYSCFDITQICPTSTALTSSLYNGLSSGMGSDVGSGVGSAPPDDECAMQTQFQSQTNSRSLQTADDDESAAPSAPSRSYGALLKSVARELRAISTSNPFALDPNESIIILSLMSSMGGAILLLILYFLREDAKENMQKKYVKAETDAMARKLLEDDMKCGRKGEHADLYQAHLSIYKKKSHDSTSIVKNIMRGYLILYNHTAEKVWRKKAPFDANNYPSVYDKSQFIDGSRSSRSSKSSNSDCVSFGYSDIYYDHIVGEDIPFVDDRQCATTAAVTEFLHKLFPGHAMFTKKTAAIHVVAENHDYLKMFGGSTLNQSRTIRFLSLVTLSLICLFTDTVFFGIFFPVDSVCQQLPSKSSCLSLPSKVQTGATRCMWSNASSTCTPRPPPTNPIFTILVSLITMILSIPLTMVIHFVLERYGSKQPGIIKYDAIQIRAKASGLHVEGAYSSEASAERIWATSHSHFGDVIRKGVTDGIATAVISPTDMAQYAFVDFLTPSEEALLILDRVHSFLFGRSAENYRLPWDPLQDTDHLFRERCAKIEAIEDYLGVFPDGLFVPLTIRQHLFFRSPTAKLQYKIEKVRKKTEEIKQIINRLKPWEEDAKDTALIREFILECLSPFKRYTLSMNNKLHEEAADAKVSWLMYIVSWTFISATLLFISYWIFAWGVYEGNQMLASWGIIFGTSAATDILAVQITKIIILYYLPAQAMQQQLHRIRNVLADISMNYINRNETSNKKEGVQEVGEICVIQHMSAACRASRSSEFDALPAAWLLRQIDDIDAQRCRDGRLTYMGLISFLAIALPMTCILINESVGDAIVESIIHGTYSSVLVAGAYLYSISLAALLITFCTLIGLFNYWKFIYIPASSAYYRRKEKLKKIFNAGFAATAVYGSSSRHSMSYATLRTEATSTPSSVRGYFKRLLLLFKHRIQHTIARLSYRRPQHMRNLAVRKVWCEMNRSSIHQGMVTQGAASYQDSDSDVELDDNPILDLEIAGALARANSRKRCILLFPDSITNMMHSTSSSKHLNQQHMKSSDSMDADSDVPRSGRSVSMCSEESSVRRHLVPVIMFDETQALNHMRTRLTRPDEDFFEVHETLLFDEFKNVLDVFYPDGVALSLTEKDEACDQYNAWKLTQNIHFRVVLEDGCPVQKRIILFQNFEEWFVRDILDVIHNTLSARLMDHSLCHTPPRRKLKHLPSFSFDAIPVQSEYRAKLKLNMKSLSFLTPQDLTSRTI